MVSFILPAVYSFVVVHNHYNGLVSNCEFDEEIYNAYIYCDAYVVIDSF